MSSSGDNRNICELCNNKLTCQLCQSNANMKSDSYCRNCGKQLYGKCFWCKTEYKNGNKHCPKCGKETNAWRDGIR